MTESFQRCKTCGIPDFMSKEFHKISDEEGYCDEHIPKDKDPRERWREMFNKFFEEER